MHRYIIGGSLVLMLVVQLIAGIFVVPHKVLAAVTTWGFTTSGDYTFDSDVLEIAGGLAQLKATTTPVSWYDTGLPYRRAITIDNTGNGSAFTNYQIKVELTPSTFTYANTSSTGADFRATDSNGTTTLDYWIEDWDNTATSTIWVEVPSIPASSNDTVYVYYGDSATSSASNGTATFIEFDDFEDGVTDHLIPFGFDTSQNAGFDPVSRRFYRFPADDGLGGDPINAIQWVNIDTWEVGFVYPGLPDNFNGSGVIYHPTEQKFYIYGGRSGSTLTNKIWSFDPATLAYETLSETLPESFSTPGVALDPSTDKVYIFGGITNVTFGTYAFTNAIYVHNLDLGTPTITDTTAQLPTAAGGIEAVYSSEDGKIYLFGGGFAATGSDIDSLDTILSYDPSSSSTNPSDTGTTLNVPMDTMASAYYSGDIYLFGGFDAGEGASAGYHDKIQKYDVSGNSLSLLSETLDKTDDDAKAFYESTNDKIYIGSIVHSTGNNNENRRKVVVAEFDPSTETLAAEPSLASIPSGWTSVGTNVSPYNDPIELGGKMILADHTTTEYVRAQKNFSSALSGIVMVEFNVSVPLSSGNAQFAVRQNGGSIAAYLRNANLAQWNIYNGADTNFASFPSNDDYYTVGMLLDIPNEKQYGVLNRSTQSSAISFWNLGQTLNQLWINTSTNQVEAFATDWFLIRNSTTGTEPSTSLGSEQTLYDSNKPTITPTTANSQSFATLSSFTESTTKNGGEIKYQLSNDGGTTWYWYNSGWVATSGGYSEANTASDINDNISAFPAGDGELLFKAYLNSDGTQLVQLDSVTLDFIASTTRVGGRILNQMPIQTVEALGSREALMEQIRQQLIRLLKEVIKLLTEEIAQLLEQK